MLSSSGTHRVNADESHLVRGGDVGVRLLDYRHGLILDEQTLLALRTAGGDLAGITEGTLRSASWAAGAGFALALWLSPSLNMLALGARMAGAWRIASQDAPVRAAGNRAAVRRGSLRCRADWFYWPRGATADTASGDGGSARDGAAFSPVWRVGFAAGGSRRPHAVYPL